MKCECGSRFERFIKITLPVKGAKIANFADTGIDALIPVNEDMDFLVCEACGNMTLAPHDIERLKEEILK